ncbi:hypothetical protein WAI453_001971 [Rhynchosporium graminicola]
MPSQRVKINPCDLISPHITHKVVPTNLLRPSMTGQDSTTTACLLVHTLSTKCCNCFAWQLASMLASHGLPEGIWGPRRGGLGLSGWL